MTTLLQKTIELLRNTDSSIDRVSAETGLGRRWLYRLLDGDFQDPGVNKIEKLHRYLTSQEEEKGAA